MKNDLKAHTERDNPSGAQCSPASTIEGDSLWPGAVSTSPAPLLRLYSQGAIIRFPFSFSHFAFFSHSFFHISSPPSFSSFHYRLWPCLCETLLICVDREDWSSDPVSEHFIIPLWPLDLSKCMQQQGLLGNDKHLITLLVTVLCLHLYAYTISK